jgi:hypothetical protein
MVRKREECHALPIQTVHETWDKVHVDILTMLYIHFVPHGVPIKFYNTCMITKSSCLETHTMQQQFTVHISSCNIISSTTENVYNVTSGIQANR